MLESTGRGFELQTELTRFFGWTKHSLKAGDRITVEYSPLRSGNTGGALVKITFMDGRTLLTPRSDAPSGASNPSASNSPN